MIGLVSSASVDIARCVVKGALSVYFSRGVLHDARAAVVRSIHPATRLRAFTPNLKLWRAQAGATWAKL